MPGTYLLIEADAGHTVVEQDESNNVRAVPLSFLLPDLSVAGSVNPVAGTAGETISVSWDVTNTGAGPAERDWVDSVYWSTDSVYDSSDVLLLEHPTIETLPAGESQNTQRTITIPAGAALGDYYLFVVSDSTSLQPESNESNNVSVPISVEVLPDLPDLVTTDGSVSPTTVRLGLDFEVSWTVENQGNIEAASSSSTRDSVYLSHDDQFDASDVLLSNVTTTDQFPLGVGSAYQRTLAARNYTSTRSRGFFESGYASGDKYVIIVADATDKIAESDLDNNIRAVPIRFEAPDLVVSSVSAPSVGVLHRDIELSWTVTNSGNLNAINFGRDSVYLSDDEFLGGSQSGDILLDSFTTSTHRPLAVGDSYAVSGTVNLANIGIGSKYLIVRTDTWSYPFGLEVEQNEDNNYFAIPISLSAAIDLNVISSSLPLTAAPGESITIEWTVRNDGTDPVAELWEDYVRLSTDTVVGGNDPVLTFYPNQFSNDPLARGDSYTRSRTASIRSNQALGSYYILLLADRQNVIGETNEANNLIVHPFEVAERESADLVVSSLDSPSNAQPDEEITITWTVFNQGIEATGAAWSDRVYRVDASGRHTLKTYRYEGAALNVGQSYTRSEQIRLDDELVDGDYQIVVETDVFDQVHEGTAEDNNETTSATILSVGHVDLVPVIVAAPATAESDETIAIEWRTENRGTAPTTSSWVDRVYLSVDGSSKTELLGEITHLDALAPGDATTLRLDARISLETTGDWHILVVSDALNELWERQQNEGSANQVSQPISIALKESADLQITDLTLPIEVQPGQEITAQWTVTNLGVEATILPASGAFWYDRLYYYEGASRRSLTDSYYEQVLGVGESYTVSRSRRLPILEDGDYLFELVTDSTDRIYEGPHEDNNIARAVVRMRHVDLVPAISLAPTEATSGTTFPVTWTVSNNGTATTSASWTDRLYLSDDETVDSGDLLFTETTQFASLVPGESVDTTIDVTLPLDLTGSRYLIVVTDWDAAFQELSAGEANNQVTSPLDVTLIDHAELSVSNVVAPTLVVDDPALITVGWTIHNDGDAPCPSGTGMKRSSPIEWTQPDPASNSRDSRFPSRCHLVKRSIVSIRSTCRRSSWAATLSRSVPTSRMPFLRTASRPITLPRPPTSSMSCQSRMRTWSSIPSRFCHRPRAANR